MNAPQGINRRRFLQSSATVAGGLMLGISVPGLNARQIEATGLPSEPGLGYFVRIEPDGAVIIGSPQPEMGQGVKTSLPMLIAEELDVDWDDVTVEQMPLGLKRDEEGNLAWLHVGQGAGGSNSVVGNWQPLREPDLRGRTKIPPRRATRPCIRTR